MIVSIGEVLIDAFPDYSRVGGAPFNFAAHVRNLGHPVRFVSRVGTDADARTILKEMQRQNVPAREVQTDDEHRTGRVNVELDANGSPRFDILTGVAYDHIDPDAVGPLDVPEPAQLVYFGTLAQRTPGGLDRIQRLLRKRPAEALGFLDINLRRNGYGQSSVEASLEQADVLKLNEEELEVLARMFSPKSGLDSFRSWLMERFGIRLMALTLGERGAELFARNGERLTARSVPVDRMKDTVGAGDAFAAVLAVGYLRGVPLRKVLSTAVSFSAAICGIEGALPADPAIYRNAAAAMEEEDHVR